ncbi:sn-glycerol-3-phosphate ABC transporter ATP-binding protein UgpC [Undibacterium sp. TS12]|uniref:ABC transporter ATP-binding protein n=1 Tax=Undibacterium sp. TS12 TaxID=2908202 RepID=UPI001F4CEEB2|nr:sn-glycerol-3-phosphate ABC transporter ATP-binding protein UgpC [Undibacterium sp. TS12]MCH8622754.1 sn-glycerol-3-phosphate ABC transporter ATP-binding protein UgpC [Undibacterium sp. TS12]
MAAVRLQQISKSYGSNQVLQGIDLQVHDGEFMVFVGPSGCGKSTLLRMIAGLEDISAGQLYINDALANDLPAAKRGLAMVFQSYALYPHMSVYDNMAFSLSLSKMSKADIDAAVQHAAGILQMSHLLQRKPRDLSGGQRQRVAIGRAIVRKPGLFLFDEPLSNLDASLRVQMRIELSKLHRDLRATMIYVTHDQVEAMTLGQRIAVFNGGKIEQVGVPLELYDKPANLFVAGFLGSPKMNILKARVVHSSANECELQLASGTHIKTGIDSSNLQAGDEVSLGIRAEHVLLASQTKEQTNQLEVCISFVEHLGDAAIVYATIAGEENLFAIKLPADTSDQYPGAELCIQLPAQRCHVFDSKSVALGR